MKFVATEMAGILQNISQNRTNKAVTCNDIRYAAATAYLSFFPGKTFYNTSYLTSELGYSSFGHIYYVKGLQNGKASVIWSKKWHSANSTYEPNRVSIEEAETRTLINSKTETNPSEIYKDLKISNGEVKIIIDAATHCGTNANYKLTDGRIVPQVGPQKIFGFYIYPFSTSLINSRSGGVFLNHIAIFTPKPGLFSETAPQ